MAKRLNASAPIQKNECYDVEITGMTHEGSGVARIHDFAVFVPHTAVGDQVQIKIVKVLQHYGFGIVKHLLHPADCRTENDCAVFSLCGGCCYRHLSYGEELRLKEQQVYDNFKRLGNIDLPPQPIVGSEQPNGYRNKAQFPLGVDENGHAIAGFYAPRSHRIVPCLDCKLLPAQMNDITAALLELIDRFHLEVYNEQTHKGALRHLFLRYAQATNQMMVCLVSARKILPQAEQLCAELTARFPQIHSIVLNYNPRTDNVILGSTCSTLWGSDTITDRLCGVDVQISPLSFYQVNHDQAERLYEEALLYAAPEQKILLDLYCGIGTIGLSAASHTKSMIGVEIIPQAIENAKINAALNGFSNTRFLCGDCKSAVQLLESEGIRPDVILVDPPRKGCDTEVLDTLVRLSPERIVMVSCNPATAARDCRLLEEQGYHVQQYRPFDLFPRTKHVETVVLMRRVEG